MSAVKPYPMTSTAPNGPPGWVVVLDKPAQEQLGKLPPHDFDRVDAVLRSMGTNPFGGDLERLTKHDRDSFRRRVGSYRILFWLRSSAARSA